MSQMASVSRAFRDSLSGSQVTSVRCDVWRGGMLVKGNVPVSDGSVSVTDGQASRTQVSLTIVDEDGSLRPLADDDAIAPYGSELNIRAGIVLPTGTESVSLGWFPITDVDVVETWQSYLRPGEDTQVMVPKGGTLSVTACDRAQLIADAPFETREQPKKSTVLAEIKRLVSGIVAFSPDPSLTDQAIPDTITYDDDRLAAVAALANVLDTDPVLSPSGALELWPRGIGTPVWTVAGGDDGVLVSVQRSLSRTGVYNAVFLTGQDPQFGLAPLVGRAYIADGPLAYGGPYGKHPYFATSQVLATQSALDRAAGRMLASLQTRRAQQMQVECAPNPAVTAGDTITLGMPNGTVDCRITAITFPLTPGGMQLTVTADPTVIGRVA